MMAVNCATRIRADLGEWPTYRATRWPRSCKDLALIRSWGLKKNSRSAFAKAEPGSRRCCWIKACCAEWATFTRMKVCGRRESIRRNQALGSLPGKYARCEKNCKKSYVARFRCAVQRLPILWTPKASPEIISSGIECMGAKAKSVFAAEPESGELLSLVAAAISVLGASARRAGHFA